jgi:energy-converting hydrogenase Eha subunit C
MVAAFWLTNKLGLPDYQVFLALGVSLTLSILVLGLILPTDQAGGSKFAALVVLTFAVVIAAAQYVGGEVWRDAASTVMLCISFGFSLIRSKKRSARSRQS